MCTPSRFLKDIDAKYLDMPSDAGASDAFASARERYGRPALPLHSGNQGRLRMISCRR